MLSTMREIPKVPWDGSGVAKPTVFLRDPPPHAGFSSSFSNSPNNNQKRGPLPSWKPCSPWPLGAFFHKQPRPSISVLRASGPWWGHADFEEVKGAGARPSSNKWVAVRGGPLLFFPGLRRGACQEDGEASRPPAAPRGEADRRRQLCGRQGSRALPSQRRGPPAPLPEPLLTSQPPSTTQDPPFQGQRARPWASLGGGPWPDGEDRAGVRLQPAGQIPGRFLSPPASCGFLPEPPQPAAPRGTSPGCSLRNSLSAPPPRSPIWNHPGKGKLDGLGREPLSSITYFALCINDFILNSPTSAGILRQWGQAAWA